MRPESYGLIFTSHSSTASLYVHYMFTICPLYVHYIFTICSLYVHHIFTTYSLHVHWWAQKVLAQYLPATAPPPHYMSTICSLYVHHMFTIYSLYVHCIFTTCSLMGPKSHGPIFASTTPPPHYMSAICSLYVHHMFTLYSLYVTIFSLYSASPLLRNWIFENRLIGFLKNCKICQNSLKSFL